MSEKFEQPPLFFILLQRSLLAFLMSANLLAIGARPKPLPVVDGSVASVEHYCRLKQGLA